MSEPMAMTRLKAMSMNEVILAIALSIPDEFRANAPNTKKKAAVVKTVTLKRNWLIVFMALKDFILQSCVIEKEKIYHSGTGGAL
jgi:hypothetical protein